MEKLNKIAYYIAGVVSIIAIITFFKGGQVNLLGDSSLPNTFLDSTNSSVSVSPATTTAVLSLNGIRKFASICNDSANTVYLSFGVPAVASKGIRLASTACFEINNTKGYLGAVNAIASSSTSTLMTVEK